MIALTEQELFEQELFDKGRVVCQEFAKGGHPKNRAAYYRYIMIKYQGKLFVLEYTPKDDELELTIKTVDY